MSKLTAAIDGLESSPGCGWVTSTPNIIVRLSLTKCILLDSASTKTMFLPPTYRTQTIYSRAPTHRNVKEVLCNTYLYINFKRNICKILFAHFKDMFRETVTGIPNQDQSHIYALSLLQKKPTIRNNLNINARTNIFIN